MKKTTGIAKLRAAILVADSKREANNTALTLKEADALVRRWCDASLKERGKATKWVNLSEALRLLRKARRGRK